jgi:hypothetical protein
MKKNGTNIKKWILCSLLLLMLAGVSLLGILYIKRAKILAFTLSQATNVEVTVQSIDVLKNGVIIHGLKIMNPPGCTLKYALSTRDIAMTFDWAKLIKALFTFGMSKIVIDSIEFNRSKMGVELFTANGSESNWSHISEALSAPSKISFSVELMIRKFVMTNIKLEVKYHSFVKASLNPTPIKRIELKNIGSDSDVGMKQLFTIISKVLVSEAASNLNLKTLIPEFFLQRFVPIPLFQAEQAGQFVWKFFNKKSKKQDDQDN